MKHIGFTGTQHGCTWAQERQLYLELEAICTETPDDTLILHHGDCIEADAKAHELGLEFFDTIVIHPPEDSRRRAFCSTKKCPEDVVIEVRAPKPFIPRNHDIVDECELLLATPDTEHPRMRSGTWATIRYALKQGKRVRIILPSGLVWLPTSVEEVYVQEVFGQ